MDSDRELGTEDSWSDEDDVECIDSGEEEFVMEYNAQAFKDDADYIPSSQEEDDDDDDGHVNSSEDEFYSDDGEVMGIIPTRLLSDDGEGEDEFEEDSKSIESQ